MKFKLLISFVFVSLRLFAQETNRSDSIYLFNIPRTVLQASKRNATALLRSPIEQVSKISLQYLYSTGDLKSAQTAKSSNEISFEADGIKKLNRFKLYGSFEYLRIQNKGLANVLRGEDIDDQPFYYIVGKESNFSRQKYYAKGIISYELLKNKLNFSSGFNYIYYLADRSVDPRMSLNWFDFQTKPELTFISKNWNLGLGGLWGYGTENTGVKYKNKDYGTGSSYPERTTYLNYGYGYAPISTDNFSRRKQYKGASLHAVGKTGLWDVLLDLKYINASDENRNSLDNSIKDLTLSKYTSETLSGYLLLTRKHRYNLKQIEISYSDLNGEDYVTGLFGKNYTATNKQFSAGFHNADTWGNNTLELGATLNYSQAYKKDAVSAHLFEYSYLRPGITGSWYQTTAAKNRYAITLAPSLQLPLNVNAVAPLTQQNAFTMTVMYPDYFYQSTTAAILMFKLNYIGNTWSNSFRTGINLNTTYIQSIKKPEITFPAATLPGDNRLSANLSLNLYF
jgi:hypothetical protein